MPVWRNWQTRAIQNAVLRTPHTNLFVTRGYAAPEVTCCNHHKGNVFVGVPPSIWIFGFAFGLGNVDIDHAVVITATNPITATVMILRMGHLSWISPHNAFSHRLYREHMNWFTHATSAYDGRRFVWQSRHTTALILCWQCSGASR